VGPEAANLAGSLAKSLEVERSPKATQRASEIAQDHDAARFVNAIKPIKADGADTLRRTKLLQERERRRRQIERQALGQEPDDSDDSQGEHSLDVMV